MYSLEKNMYGWTQKGARIPLVLAFSKLHAKCTSTVEPPKRGQQGDEPFVLSREVVLFRRFLFLSLKMKHSCCLDTNTTNKRECNQLSQESVDLGSICKRLYTMPFVQRWSPASAEYQGRA